MGSLTPKRCFCFFITSAQQLGRRVSAAPACKGHAAEVGWRAMSLGGLYMAVLHLASLCVKCSEC